MSGPRGETAELALALQAALEVSPRAYFDVLSALYADEVEIRLGETGGMKVTRGEMAALLTAEHDVCLSKMADLRLWGTVAPADDRIEVDLHLGGTLADGTVVDFATPVTYMVVDGAIRLVVEGVDPAQILELHSLIEGTDSPTFLAEIEAASANREADG